MPAFLANHSKLIAAIVGNVIGLLVAWLATKGLATCVPGVTPDAEQACTVLGFSTTDVTTYFMIGINALFVWAFPPNKPAA